MSEGRVPVSFEKLTISTSAVMLTSSLLHPTPGQSGAGNAACLAFMTVEGGSIRFRVDGGSPTTADGHLVLDGGSVEIETIQALEKFKAIRAANKNATLFVTYFF